MFSFLIKLYRILDLRDSDIDGIEKRDLVDEPSIRSLLTCKNVHEEENSLHSMPCGNYFSSSEYCTLNLYLVLTKYYELTVFVL